MLEKFKNEGKTIIIASPNILDASKYADRMLILKEGFIINPLI